MPVSIFAVVNIRIVCIVINRMKRCNHRSNIRLCIPYKTAILLQEHRLFYTVPKSFKNTIKALQELGILNSKLYMDKDYLPGDSTSYKEYTGEYYYDDYTSSSDLYDYTDDSYIDDSEY